MDLLISLLRDLDGYAHIRRNLDNYYQGIPKLSFLSAEDKIALRKFDRISSNVCRATVLSYQERLRVNGFTGPNGLWQLWIDNNLDQLAATAHNHALLYGQAYVICWEVDGKPTATVESPKNVVVQRDPATRQVTAAVKRWRSDTQTFANVFLPDRVEKYVADTAGTATAAFKLVETLDNPLGVVPVAVIGLEDDCSVLDDVTTLQDALNKLLLDAMVASEFSGRPRRWATGVSAIERPVLDDDGEPVLDDDGEPVLKVANPFPEQNKLMLADDEGARIGQLDAADLNGFEAGVRILCAQVEMVTGLPAHYLGQISQASQPTSAESLHASEAALVARCEARQLAYGTGWERVGQLLISIRDSVDPDSVKIRVQWAPADTRSVAAEADSVVKLVQSGILPVSYALKKLGYSDDEVAAIRAAKRAESLDQVTFDREAA